MSGRAVDLDNLYAILDALRVHLGGSRYLGRTNGRSRWPKQGVYFFFEDGELREDGQTLRVVRVGTHAVSEGSNTTLWGRLSQHKGTTGGATPGGGSHRGSVFRRHVGTALLNLGTYPPGIGRHWGQGNSAAGQVRLAEHPLERDVSAYIGGLPFLWLAIPGSAAVTNDRKVIEANAIALLSNARRAPIDPPSPGWLGHRAADPAIQASGLWNVDHVYDRYDPAFLSLLAGYMARI